MPASQALTDEDVTRRLNFCVVEYDITNSQAHAMLALVLLGLECATHVHLSSEHLAGSAEQIIHAMSNNIPALQMKLHRAYLYWLKFLGSQL